MKLNQWVAGPVAIVAMLGMNARSSEAPDHDGDGAVPGLVTLYCGDPLAHDFSFARGCYGGVFEDYQRKSAGVDLDFSAYWPGEFTVGLEGGSKCSIVDLGSVDALQAKYRYEETVGGGQGFASIRREGTQWVILRDYRRQTTQPLSEGRALPHAQNHATVAEHHVYLARLATTDPYGGERFVKFMVVKHDPLGSVTLRWAVVG